MGIGWQLALVVTLVVGNALFAGSEIALISLREGQIQRLEQRGNRGRLTARLARDPNRFLATIQIGITLAGFLASATAAVTLAHRGHRDRRGPGRGVRRRDPRRVRP